MRRDWQTTFQMVSPNPSTDQLTIKGTADEEFLNFKLLDTSHRLVQTWRIKTENGAAILNFKLANGLYFLKIEANSGASKVFKVVVNK